MSSTNHLVAFRPPLLSRRWRPFGRGSRRTELCWAAAFVAPYLAVFLAFIVNPFASALWMARAPALYEELWRDPVYRAAVVNTLLFAGLGVNIKMLLALLLSDFFLRRRWWVKALLAVFLLPWLIATAEACVSFHWMLSGRWGLVDRVLWAALGIDGPDWLVDRWLALGSDIVAYIWKWLPFWTLIFMAGRMTIPAQLYDAAAIDGASGFHRFRHVTWPLLANLYLICTLLSALWTLGDFTTVYLVSMGGPADMSQVLATLGFQYAFDNYKPALGVAVVMSALPVLVPVVLALLRRVRASEVQL